MLEISEKDYRELRRIDRLRKEWRISKGEYRRLVDGILDPARREEELREQEEEKRKQKEEALRKKQKQRQEFQQKLRSCDAGYGKRGGAFVKGGLPSLGKRR